MNAAGGATGGSAPAPLAVTWVSPRGVRRGVARRRGAQAWLVLQFALKDFKIRYTSSALGYTWSVINPLMFFGLYYVVFSVFMRFPIPNYTGFLLLSVVMWNFFSEGSANGTASLLARADILSKMVLPRQVVVYSALLSAGLTFVINLAVLLIVLRATGTQFTAAAACFPLLLIDLAALTLGVSLLLSPLYVRFRDVGYLWGIALQVGFWVTPIIYSEEMIPPHWRWLFWCNPVARLIGDSRKAVVYGLWPGVRGLALTTLAAAVVCVMGAVVFRRLQARVVEHF
ncbi:MAG: ABC transporter permease [Candidatus Binatia bacterium]